MLFLSTYKSFQTGITGISNIQIILHSVHFLNEEMNKIKAWIL